MALPSLQLGPRSSEYNWSSIDNLTFTPTNYQREFFYPRPLFDVYSYDDADYFTSICTTPQRAQIECHGWSSTDLKLLEDAQETVHTFQVVLNTYYDLGFQMILVLYIWGVGLYLLWKRHFNFYCWSSPHRFEPTVGTKWFLNFHTTFTAEEVKTVIVTDSEEDDKLFYGVDLSDYISESDEGERKMRKDNPNEYGRLISRKIRHEDELINEKYNNEREIKRKKRQLPNVNNAMNGTKIRNFEPPRNSGKKFDRFGTPKYPKIYEIRRMVNQPNRYLARL